MTLVPFGVGVNLPATLVLGPADNCNRPDPEMVGNGFRTRRIEDIEPDHFVLWMFPRLFQARLPRYEAIAREYGYTIRADVLATVQTEEAFLACVETALREQA